MNPPQIEGFVEIEKPINSFFYNEQNCYLVETRQQADEYCKKLEDESKKLLWEEASFFTSNQAGTILALYPIAEQDHLYLILQQPLRLILCCLFLINNS